MKLEAHNPLCVSPAKYYGCNVRSRTVNSVLFAAVCSLFAGLFGCASPQAIGAFAQAAQSALAAGPPLFADIHDSCVRRETARPSLSIRPLFVPPGSKDAPPPLESVTAACARFTKQAQGLTQVSDVLAAYFRAIQQLASFNTSSVSAAGLTAAENAAGAAELSSTQIDSAGQLATFVTEIFTAHYQRSRLLEYLNRASPQVASVTTGFEAVIKNYEVFLDEEQQTLTARYQTVGNTSQPAMVLLLNRAYSDDLAEIARRRAAAASYVEALQTIREGDQKLLEASKHMNAKETSLALQPYTSKLNSLAPAAQKSN